MFRLISLLTEEGLVPCLLAILRIDSSRSRPIAISSRSSLEKWVEHFPLFVIYLIIVALLLVDEVFSNSIIEGIAVFLQAQMGRLTVPSVPIRDRGVALQD